MVRGSMIFLAVFSFLLVLIGYFQMLNKVTDIQTSSQKLTDVLDMAYPQAQMMSACLGNVNAEIQMLKKDLQNVSSESQRANSNLKNASDEIQILKRGLENANVQTQMANSSLKSASDEIKKIKESLENTNAFNSEAQRLSSGLEKANGEIQKIMESLVNTSSLKVEVQGLKQQLENLTAQQQQQQQSHQSSLLQLVIQGWHFYKGNAYYFSETQKTWDEAEEFCVAHNSHLASVTSDDEQEFLSKRTNGVYHWIGLTDKDTEGTWHWVDGTPYNENKVFWNTNQPDNWQYGKGLSEDCVHTEVKWNDMLCDKPHPWICKRWTGLPEQRP